MKGDQPLSIPLNGFWSPLQKRQNRRATDVLLTQQDNDHPESAWDELVHWFEQQREWAEVAACFDAAYE